MLEIVVLTILITLVSIIGGYVIYIQFKELKENDKDYKKKFENIEEKNKELTTNINSAYESVNSLSTQLTDAKVNFIDNAKFEEEKLNIYTKLASGNFSNDNGMLKWCPNGVSNSVDCKTIITTKDDTSSGRALDLFESFINVLKTIFDRHNLFSNKYIYSINPYITQPLEKNLYLYSM